MTGKKGKRGYRKLFLSFHSYIFLLVNNLLERHRSTDSVTLGKVYTNGINLNQDVLIIDKLCHLNFTHHRAYLMD